MYMRVGGTPSDSSVGRGFGGVGYSRRPVRRPVPVPMMVFPRGGPRGIGQIAVPVDVGPGLRRIHRGLGQATIPVNVGPGVIVNMTPADAAAYWATGAVTSASGGDASQGVGGSNPTISGAYGTYAPTVVSAYQSSPTIGYELESSADVSNPEPPALTFASTNPVTSPALSAEGFNTPVPSLQSTIDTLLTEMTSGPQSGSQANPAGGAAYNIQAQAEDYCQEYGVADCSNINSIVQSAQSEFANWQGSNLESTVGAGGTVSDVWSGGGPLNINPGGLNNPAPDSGSAGGGYVVTSSEGGTTSTVAPRALPISGTPTVISTPPVLAPAGSSPETAQTAATAAAATVAANATAASNPLTATVAIGSTSIPLWMLLAAGAAALLLIK
jgi:hypothetical protein